MSVSFLIKLQLLDLQIIKKGSLHRFFPVNFATFLRRPFSLGRLRCLLLKRAISYNCSKANQVLRSFYYFFLTKLFDFVFSNQHGFFKPWKQISGNCAFLIKILLLLHENPFPLNPSGHAQLNDPSVSLHSAIWLSFFQQGIFKHSFILVHLGPW